MSRALILAKAESQYGVDPTPTGADDAILTTLPTFEVVGRSIERTVVKSSFGKIGVINVGEGLKITFGVEVAGSGTPTTPPRIAPLLKALSFTQTIDADSVDYAPNSDLDTASCTIYFYYAGKLHKMLGCVAESMKLDAKANEYCMLEFSLTGIYAGDHATETAMATATYLQQTPPVFRSASLAFGGYAALCSAVAVEVTNTLGKSIDVNQANPITRYRVTEREVKGSLDPEVVALSSFNPWTLWAGSTAGALGFTIGSAAGNRLVVSMPNAMPTDPPKYTERETIPTYTYPFVATTTLSVANNELALSFT